MNEDTRKMITEATAASAAVYKVTDHLYELTRLARLAGDDEAKAEFLAIEDAVVEVANRISRALKAHQAKTPAAK